VHHGSNPGVSSRGAAANFLSSTINRVSDPVRIGILGDFNPEFRSHHSTNDALQHAARKLGMEVRSEWIPTSSLTAPDAEKKLETFDGFWGSRAAPTKASTGC